MTLSMDARQARIRELSRLTKPELCTKFRGLGYIGGKHPLSQWRKDEIITGIIDQEQHLAEAAAVAAKAETVTSFTEFPVDVTKPYIVRVDRTDHRADRPAQVMLTYATYMQPDGDILTAIGAAQRQLVQSRAGHLYRGPARVYVWNHRGDEEHYRAPVPEHAAAFDFAAQPEPEPAKLRAVD